MINSGFVQYYDFSYHYWEGEKDPEVEPVDILMRIVDFHWQASLDDGLTWDPVLMNGRDWGWDLTPLE